MKVKGLFGDSVEPDLIDRIANALPESVRSDYYRELVHCRSLPENDEMLRILRAMQFLTLLMKQVPSDVTVERERLESLFTAAMKKIEENLRSCQTYQKLLDERLSRLPDQVKQGISPDIIAGKINESLRQQFVRSTIPQTAEALTLAAEQMKKTTTEFGRTAGHLTDSYSGVAAQAERSINEIRSSIGHAAQAAKLAAQELTGTFRYEYRWAISILSCLALILGIGIGMLFQQRLDQPSKAKSEIQYLSPPVVTPEIYIPKKR
jgi:hypothetical protein